MKMRRETSNRSYRLDLWAHSRFVRGGGGRSGNSAQVEKKMGPLGDILMPKICLDRRIQNVGPWEALEERINDCEKSVLHR